MVRGAAPLCSTTRRRWWGRCRCEGTCCIKGLALRVWCWCCAHRQHRACVHHPHNNYARSPPSVRHGTVRQPPAAVPSLPPPAAGAQPCLPRLCVNPHSTRAVLSAPRREDRHLSFIPLSPPAANTGTHLFPLSLIHTPLTVLCAARREDRHLPFIPLPPSAANTHLCPSLPLIHMPLQYSVRHGEKTATYTFYTAPNGWPLKLYMMGVNLLTGGTCVLARGGVCISCAAQAVHDGRQPADRWDMCISAWWCVCISCAPQAVHGGRQPADSLADVPLVAMDLFVCAQYYVTWTCSRGAQRLAPDTIHDGRKLAQGWVSHRSCVRTYFRYKVHTNTCAHALTLPMQTPAELGSNLPIIRVCFAQPDRMAPRNCITASTRSCPPHLALPQAPTLTSTSCYPSTCCTHTFLLHHATYVVSPPPTSPRLPL